MCMTTLLLEERIEGMSSSKGVPTTLLERVSLVLRLRIVRVFAVVESLPEFYEGGGEVR
jgi:hypothetical protein